MKRLYIILVNILFIALNQSSSLAVTLDREGKGQRHPDYFTCTNIALDGSAGGNPYFKIALKGLCAVHPGDGLAGWTPLDWSAIAVKGSYNYDTKVAKETIWDGPNIIFEANLDCKKNPWAHGAYIDGKTCSVKGSIINNVASHYVVIKAPYPLSSIYMDNSLRSTLNKWETTPTTTELLTDWDPYGGPKGTDHIKVVKPGNFENIDASLPYYLFKTAVNQPHAELSGSSNLEIEQLEVVAEVIGDIAMPSAGSQWWQTMWTGSLPIPEFPMGISQGLFNGKTGQFRIRVQGRKKSSYTSLGGWSSWTYFCIGVSDGCQKTAKQLQAITKSTKAGKIAITKGLFKSADNKTKKALVMGSKPNQPDTQLSRNSASNVAKVGKVNRILVNKISKPGQPDTRLTRNPGNEQTKQGLLKSYTIGSKTLTAVLPKAKVLVDRVAHKPAPLTVGKMLDMDIRFNNVGVIDSNVNQEYTIKCIVLIGGACPVANKTAAIGKSIKPDGSTSVILMGANKAEAGKFVISIALAGQVGRPYSFNIDVKPVMAIKKVNPRKIQPVGQTPKTIKSIKPNGSNLRMMPVN